LSEIVSLVVLSVYQRLPCSHVLLRLAVVLALVGLFDFQSGPCGVLAAVQAYLLRYILFIAPGAVASTAALRAVCLDATQRRSALLWACAALLHQVCP
jgi:hypothetical protein